jgi:hypothetical protein
MRGAGYDLENFDLDRRAVPLLSVLGPLGLAAWCIYWDLRRRIDPQPAQPRPQTRATRSWTLQVAAGSLAAGWLLRYLSDRWGVWLTLSGYGAFVAGIVLLAVHVGRRLANHSGGPGTG